MKIIDVINKICQFHGDVGEHAPFDKVIYGDAEKECTGIVTTCNGTVEVIRETAKRGANFLIVHEDVFYNSFDKDELVEGVALVDEKRKLLDETGIVIWRDHDHMHGGGPKPMGTPRDKTDYIYYGIMKELGWEEYLVGDIKKPLLYEIPETDVPTLCHELMEKLNLNGVRIVGKADAKVKRVFICEHVNDRHDEELYKQMDELNADVFIPLEIVDWTLSEYVRDAVAMGQNKAILEMGHFNFEEPGMKYMAEAWLPELLGNEIPVSFVQSGDSFHYITK
jgi:putative NIF3 family GTP cyclohydrolase 1 type 2